MSHRCHAVGCNTLVQPKFLMCGKHWSLVPNILKDRVWKTYRPGQEKTKDPSGEYLEAHLAAVRAVAEIEGRV